MAQGTLDRPRVDQRGGRFGIRTKCSREQSQHASELHKRERDPSGTAKRETAGACDARWASGQKHL